MPADRTGPAPRPPSDSVAAGELDVRLAGPDEVEVAADILEDAIAWAAGRGLDSWTPGVFAERAEWGQERLEEALAAGGLYVVRIDGSAVATFSLLPEDRLFWPEAGDDALYLHRFAVRRAASGTGVGRAALEWMDGEARRRGRRFLRLDCLSDNPGIRAYYERAGFVHRGETVVRDIRFSLYERRVGEQRR